MADLSTNYLGLNLKNPIIVGSCGLTSNIEDIKKLEKNGAAAVVLKSIFEEEILHDINQEMQESINNEIIYTDLSETLDYVDLHIKEKKLDDYLSLISKCKKETLIPIIASINCITDSEWTEFAAKIQNAGADAIELNIYLNPTNLSKKEFEKITHNIINKVLKAVNIPVCVKLGNCYTNLGQEIIELSKTGISGLVLFNRFFSVDIDIHNLTTISNNVFSSPNEYQKALRWIGLLSDKVSCSLAASTGIYYSSTIIKQILAGADAVQIVSALYLNGADYISQLLFEMEQWMNKKGFYSIKHYKGKLSYNYTGNPSVYERLQFMKHYGKIEENGTLAKNALSEV